MKILVTGANGFVGKHVVRELDKEHELLTPGSADLNVRDKSAFWDYVHDNDPDAIVHLAAICGGIGINKDNPGRFIHENLELGINVLEGARRLSASRTMRGLPGVQVVNLGTVCSYPKYANIPFVEQEIWDGYPEETNAPYGIAKKTIMEMGRAYTQQYGLRVANLIPVNMYGEHDNFNLYSSHVIPALIRKCEEADLGVAKLWGTGSASREFLYAGDCARAISVALEHDVGPDPINLGTGQEITIRDLAEMIRRVGGYDVEFEWDSTKPDGQPRRCLDVSRAENVLKWSAVMDLEQGLKRTIEWYRNARV